MSKHKYNVAHDRTGHPWGYDERGGYWGPFSAWGATRPSFFGALVVAWLDAAGLYEHFHTTTPAFPFMVLGQPSALVDQREMKIHRGPFALIQCGCRLDLLLLRMRLLAVECESFRTLKEGLEARR